MTNRLGVALAAIEDVRDHYVYEAEINGDIVEFSSLREAIAETGDEAFVDRVLRVQDVADELLADEGAA